MVRSGTSCNLTRETERSSQADEFRSSGESKGMTTGHIDPRYGDPSAAAPPSGDIERLLTQAQLYWIVTVRVDGRPHAVPLVGVWHAGAFAFAPARRSKSTATSTPTRRWR